MLFSVPPPPILLAVQAPLTVNGWIAILVTVAIFAAMQRRRTVSVDLLFLGGLVLVTLTGVLSAEQALEGFSNKAVVMIAALFAASEGLRVTGALDWIGNKLLGGATTERGALVRLATAIVPASAFILNTPLVAMMAPVVVDWCRQRSISPSRLLIPLSYFTIIGGVCTLIGTSTTLVINGELAGMASGDTYASEVVQHIGELSFFETSWAGVPLAIVGVTYMLLMAPRRLPNRTDLVEQFDEHRRDYLVEMQVEARCPLIGKTVQNAGLRNLPGLFLIEITRGSETITPVSPHDIIRAADQMVFTGVVTTIADLERIPGLVPAVDSSFETQPAQRVRRELTEVVLSRTSPLIGLTVRASDFRKRYNAAVVAVHRNGERLTNKVGSIRLEPGDTLLLQTRNEFVESHRNSRDFYLVSRVGKTTARRHDRALWAGLLFSGLILWLTVTSLWPNWLPWGNLTSKSIAAIAIVLAMILTRCLTTSEARSAIDLQVLLTIGAALGIGKALEHSGAARWLAQSLESGTTLIGVDPDWKPYLLLAIVYLLSQLFTETITNIAVASIMIPVAVNVAVAGDYHPRPFIIAVTLAASLSFITPIGYQTNLMVMGPGGYKGRDYFRVGWPLALLLTVSALVLIPALWPFAHAGDRSAATPPHSSAAPQRHKARLALMQSVPTKWDLKQNFAVFLDMLEVASEQDAEIFITPECWLDGYAAPDKTSTPEKLRQLAQPLQGSQYLDRVAREARERKMYICFGFTSLEEGKIYNASGLWDNQGHLLGVYHKTHLQTHDLQYEFGQGLPVWPSPWGPLGIMICADRRWPETARTLRLQGAKLILNPTYGMHHEANEWWMRTRGYENQCFIAFTHPNVGFVVDPKGNVTAKRDESPGVLIAEVDLRRAKNDNHLRDRRPELYRAITEHE